jgi:hypothetical protein
MILHILVLMTMTLERVEEKLDMGKTFLVQINPEQSTLPIDVASTWTQGFLYINKILEMIDKDTFVETYLDETGEARRRTSIHPLLLPMLQERRRMIEQVWKISGGEIMNEAKKSVVKGFAKQLYESQLSKQKEKYQKNFIEIIEGEVQD